MYHVAKESNEFYAGVTRIVEAPPPPEEPEKPEVEDEVVEFGQDGPTLGGMYGGRPGEGQLPPTGMGRPGQPPPRGPTLPQQQIQLQQLQMGQPGPGGAPPPNPFVQRNSPSFNNGVPLPQQSPVPVMPPTFGPASPFIASGPGAGSPHPMQAPGSPQGPFVPQYFQQAQAAMQQQQLGGMPPSQVFQGAPTGMFAGAAVPPMGMPGAPQPGPYGQNLNPAAMMAAARAGMAGQQPGSYAPGTTGMSAVQLPPGIMGQSGIGPMGGGDPPAGSGGGTAINLQNMQSMGGLQQQQQFLVQQQMQMAALMRAQAAQQQQQQQGGVGGSGPGGINPNAFNPRGPSQQPPGISPQQMGNPQQLGQTPGGGGQEQGSHSPSPGLAPTPRARVDGRPQRQPRERKGAHPFVSLSSASLTGICTGMSEYVMIGDDVADGE